MSVGNKSLPARRAHEGGESSDGAAVREEDGLPRGGGGSRNRKQKAARYGRCFSGLELSIGPAPLKDVDAGRLKDQVSGWAEFVVAFARQISFGAPRSVNKSSGGTTPRSSTFPAPPRSSRLGAAKNDEPPSDA